MFRSSCILRKLERTTPLKQLIEVIDLKKTYKRPQVGTGMGRIIRTLIAPNYKIVEAIKDINFTIAKGEAVGYIGPNGSGKSTTIKLLTGVLKPDGGQVIVEGMTPWKNRMHYVKNIGVVFGQRSQLWWDLPVIDSFRLNKFMYRISDDQFKQKMIFLNDLLKIDEIGNVPVRTLSLGQRMRAEIGIAILHSPSVLFLDEPTIGLDLEAKQWIRKAIFTLRNELQTTVLLTSHDLQDIEQICNRIIVIDKGQIIYNGSLSNIQEKANKYCVLIVEYFEPPLNYQFMLGVSNIKVEQNKQWLRVDRSIRNIPDLLKELADMQPIRDLTISEEGIEEIVQQIYQGKLSDLTYAE